MSIKYSIDDKNFISYEILDNFVIVKFIFFDKVSNLKDCIKEYIDYFMTLDVDFLGCYPGTCNPVVIQSTANIFSEYGLKYRIFYNGEEVPSPKNFIEKTVKPCVQKILSMPNENISQSACDGNVGKNASKEGFGSCCIFGQLNKKTKDVKTPIRYYKVDDQGFLCEEFLEKPNDSAYYYKSIRLKDMFKSYKILLDNGFLKYLPKD
jgi:hypothetical protein